MSGPLPDYIPEDMPEFVPEIVIYIYTHIRIRVTYDARSFARYIQIVACQNCCQSGISIPEDMMITERVYKCIQYT